MNMKKFSKNAVPNMIDHCERSESDRNCNRSNDSIDSTRSHLNCNLAAEIQPLPTYEYLKKRLSEIYIHGNAKVYMVGWIVTAPKTLPEDEHEEFFKACFDFFVKTYGEKNVLSAVVHKDETSSHLHFLMLPIVEGKKGEKLSAKELITRQHLREMHPQMEAYVSNVLGHHVDIINGATREGNKSLEEFKRGKAKKDLENAKVKLDEAIEYKKKIEAAEIEFCF